MPSHAQYPLHNTRQIPGSSHQKCHYRRSGQRFDSNYNQYTDWMEGQHLPHHRNRWLLIQWQVKTPSLHKSLGSCQNIPCFNRLQADISQSKTLFKLSLCSDEVYRVLQLHAPILITYPFVLCPPNIPISQSRCMVHLKMEKFNVECLTFNA